MGSPPAGRLFDEGAPLRAVFCLVEAPGMKRCRVLTMGSRLLGLEMDPVRMEKDLGTWPLGVSVTRYG